MIACLCRWRSRVSPAIVALGVLTFFVLAPTRPMAGETKGWMDPTSVNEAKQAHEISHIYLVLKHHEIDLCDSSAWKVAETIQQESQKHALNPALVLAVIRVESSFRHRAVSTKGARGLMQVRDVIAPALAEQAQVEIEDTEKGLEDPVLNIKLGVFYLSYLKKIFNDLKLALTAYNWGPTRVQQIISNGEEPPRGYADRVLTAYQAYRKKGAPPKKASPSAEQEDSESCGAPQEKMRF